MPIEFRKKSFVQRTGVPDYSSVEMTSEPGRELGKIANSRQLKLVGIGTVKNEADIIESFVRHNLERLDALVVIDDGSVDGTKEILLSLEAEGLNLITLEWDGPAGYEQSKKLSELLLVVISRGEFDWIFPLDADEAIDCGSRTNLEKALQRVGKGRVGTLPWRTYFPSAGDDSSQLNPFVRIVNRRDQEAPQYFKVAIPTSEFRLRPIVIAPGSHTVCNAGTFKRLSMTALEGVTLAHFPVRTPDQLVNKVICGWLAMLAEKSGRPTRSFHWRDMFAQFMQKGVPTPDELERLGRCYSGQIDNVNTVRSPLRVDDRSLLRYGKKQGAPIFVTLARTAEQIIGKVKGSGEDNFPDLIPRRTAWRRRAVLLDERRPDQEDAIQDYLDRRFGPSVLFFDEECKPIKPNISGGKVIPATNQVNAIVLVKGRTQGTKLQLEYCSEEVWIVDRTATLAVRLLASSARVRRYSVVLVPRQKGEGDQVSREDITGPSLPGWRENVCRAFLLCHFLIIRTYWFFRLAIGKGYFTGTSNHVSAICRSRFSVLMRLFQ